MLLEDGKKYPLRGNAAIKLAGAIEGGEYKVGDEFKDAPPAFLEHAKDLWNEYMLENEY